MRQKVRKTIAIISLLLFPITLNYFSPYVSIDGAMSGIISGSLLLFLFMFLSAMHFGRAWCSWVCPMAGLSETCIGINHKNVNAKRLKIVCYSIFGVWAGFLSAMFIMAGGIKGIDPLHLTENVVSVDLPAKYITYYLVLALFLAVTLLVGKRGACHTICWMSPFLVGGMALGKFLKVPQLKIIADSSRCIACGVCDKNCPMSISVSSSAKDGYIKSSDCILCGECVDNCKAKVFRFGIRRFGIRRKPPSSTSSKQQSN